MSTAGDQLARLLALVPWLRAHPGVAPQVAADEFGISLDQLEADLNLLIVCGVPGGQHGDLFDIDFWADDETSEATDPDVIDDSDEGPIRLGTSITVHDAQTLDRPMRLRPDEAVSLLLGLHLLKELPGRFDRDRLDALAARIEAVAGDALTPLDGVVRVDPAAGLDPDIVSAVETALTQGLRLDLEYLVPSRDEITQRQVDPERAAFIDGRRYLVAWCRSADARRHFRLDRIVSAKVSDLAAEEHDQPMADGDPRPAYRSEPGALGVVLDLQPSARWIAEYAVVDELTELAGGAVRVRLSTTSLPWVAQLVLRAGGAAAVREPESLVTLVREQAAAALSAQSAGFPA